ncbi:MAG: adenylate/guanylate cyclase domain-containing protein [Rhodobacteraceae bacterium]|nr:adenylate/guanylate cyclase domain-containing protein [Paracoccaceae bacterium]
MLFAVFVALGVSGVNYQPIVVLSNEWLTFFFIMNMSYFSLIMVSFFVIYEGAVDKAETELADLNHELEEKVASQVKELERFGRLKRFLSPQVASVIVEGGNESQLESHRAEITVLFADLRGFTNFADQTIPETVMAALNAYHGLAGPLINKYEGTLERFAGDGFMVFFNDPVPCQDPGLRAARLAHDLHSGFDAAISSFSSQDCPLGLGIGIAQGPATLGPVGFEDRLDYAAIGSVTNLASRLCDTARDTQTLISKEVSNAVRGYVEMSKLGEFNFKGLSEEITVFDLTNTNGQAA